MISSTQSFREYVNTSMHIYQHLYILTCILSDIHTYIPGGGVFFWVRDCYKCLRLSFILLYYYTSNPLTSRPGNVCYSIWDEYQHFEPTLLNTFCRNWHCCAMQSRRKNDLEARYAIKSSVKPSKHGKETVASKLIPFLFAIIFLMSIKRKYIYKSASLSLGSITITFAISTFK